jgi:DNA-binding HxlR family transcriptional regulator
VRTYGQYCPIARGAEIFAERWTPLIIRNLYLGCGSFGEILEGAPGLSRTLLSQRLKHLERLGIVESEAKPDGHGRHYELTLAGHDLFTVCKSLGEWGAHWLEIAPEHLDPFVALWSMCNVLRRDRLPDRRVVIRFDFTGRQRAERYWLLIEHGEPEICKTCPGLEEDLIHHGGRRSLRQMARRATHLGRSHPRSPHPTARPLVARTSLPHLERPQRLRSHQARLRDRCDPGRLTASTHFAVRCPA